MPENKLSFYDFVKRYFKEGEEIPPRTKAICDFLEKNPNAKFVIQGTSSFRSYYREGTLHDPSPTSFMEDYHGLVPQGAWAHQGVNCGIADSVGAANMNGNVIQQYSQVILELRNRGLSDEWIKEILSIAFDYSMDPHEVADMMKAARTPAGEKDAPGIIIIDDPISPLKRYQAKMDDITKKFKEIPLDVSLDKKRRKGKEKFSKAIEEKFRQSRVERLKEKKNRKSE